MSTDVTHFTQHMTKMTGAMDTPKATIASLWEMLASSPWWKTNLNYNNSDCSIFAVCSLHL